MCTQNVGYHVWISFSISQKSIGSTRSCLKNFLMSAWIFLRMTRQKASSKLWTRFHEVVYGGTRGTSMNSGNWKVFNLDKKLRLFLSFLMADFSILQPHGPCSLPKGLGHYKRRERIFTKCSHYSKYGNVATFGLSINNSPLHCKKPLERSTSTRLRAYISPPAPTGSNVPDEETEPRDRADSSDDEDTKVPFYRQQKPPEPAISAGLIFRLAWNEKRFLFVSFLCLVAGTICTLSMPQFSGTFSFK